MSTRATPPRPRRERRTSRVAEAEYPDTDAYPVYYDSLPPNCLKLQNLVSFAATNGTAAAQPTVRVAGDRRGDSRPPPHGRRQLINDRSTISRPKRTLAEVLRDLDRQALERSQSKAQRLEAARRLLIQLHKACDGHDCCGLGYSYTLDPDGLHIKRQGTLLATWVSLRSGRIALAEQGMQTSPVEAGDVDEAVLLTAKLIREDAASLGVKPG